MTYNFINPNKYIYCVSHLWLRKTKLERRILNWMTAEITVNQKKKIGVVRDATGK